MEYPHGKFFFHYTTRDAAFGSIIPRGKLRLSSLERMRDPLENKTWFLPGAIGVGRNTQSSDVKKGEATLIEFNLLANEIRKRARLLALTTDASGYSEPAADFSRGWARARMWEQYAEKHHGVCLIFDAEILIAEIARSLAGSGLSSAYHKPVEYTETGSAEITLDLSSLSGWVSPENVAKYIEDHHVELFFQKALDWETEREYRFVMTAPSDYDDDIYVDYGEALKAVIAGEKFPAWQRASATDVCEGERVEALRLDWTLGRPKLASLPRSQPTREKSEQFVNRLGGLDFESAPSSGSA